MSAVDEIQTETLDLLRAILPAGQPVAVLDFPLYDNPGDALIFLGTIAYLRRLDVPVRYIADIDRYDPGLLRTMHPSGPILLQGGGNFGDRWVRFQPFRERVVRDFSDREIVQLPQGIEFRTEEGLRRAQDAYGSHPALTILMRDTIGLETARASFPTNRVIFCPDLAMGYGLVSAAAPSVDLLALKRDDSESSMSTLVPDGAGARSTVQRDWGLSRAQRLQWNALRVPLAVLKRLQIKPAYFLAHRAYLALANVQVDSARSILGAGRVIVTDRLHAAVLGVLLGRPVVALNNANGKIAAMYRDYLGRIPLFAYVDTPFEAEEAVTSRLNEAL